MCGGQRGPAATACPAGRSEWTSSADFPRARPCGSSSRAIDNTCMRSSLAERLRHVYWIGGGSGADKSTIARRIAAEHGLRLYDTDAMMAEHARRSTPQEAPRLAEFIAMDMDERWLNRTPEDMLRTFHWFHGEAFPLLVEDLLSLEPVVAEGFRLLPRLVCPLLDDPRQALWLLPTPEFRLAAFESRGSLWKIAGQTSDPGKALANLLERDRLFTEELRAEAKQLGLQVIEVDGSLSEDELVSECATHLLGPRDWDLTGQ